MSIIRSLPRDESQQRMKSPVLKIQQHTQTAEQRVYQRTDVFRTATIFTQNREVQYPCSILNISKGGAKLSAERAAEVPLYFELINEKFGLETWCELRWQLSDEIGVMFIDTPEARTQGDSGTEQPISSTEVARITNPASGNFNLI